jgi:hypothetical protein
MLPQIIDDSLDPSFVDDVEKFLFSNWFPWYYVDNVAMEGVTDASYLRVGFSHLFYGEENKNNYNLQNFEQLKTIITANTSGRIDRIRAFIHIPVPGELRVDHDTVHVDKEIPHRVVVYYVNDSDGDTLIFNKHYTDCKSTDPTDVVMRVTPKKGRIVLFDGSQYHCATPPSKNPRCIINFNLSAEL